MKILQIITGLTVILTPMVILLMMISLSSCKINKEVDFDQTVMDGRSPAFSVETKERAIAACTLMKQKEHNWKSEDIRSYCKEYWRGYMDFIKESQDA